MVKSTDYKAWRAVGWASITLAMGLFTIVMFSWVVGRFNVAWLVFIEAMLLAGAISASILMEKRLPVTVSEGGIEITKISGRVRPPKKMKEIEDEIFEYIKEREGSIDKDGCIADLKITEEQFDAAVRSLEQAKKLRLKKG